MKVIRVLAAVDCTGVQWLIVRCDPDCDWAVDTCWDDTLTDQERKGKGMPPMSIWQWWPWGGGMPHVREEESLQ